MSFGTFNLFNFFQQPNSGKFPVRNDYDAGSIINGAGRSGEVSDYNWEFPYAGTAVPFEIVEGGGDLFQVKLFSDSDVGLQFATINQSFSGQVQGDIEKGSSFNVISGVFFPKDSDFESSFVVFSGLVTGSPPDISPSYLLFSGQILSGQADLTLPFISFSGSFGECIPDVRIINHVFSGNLTSGNSDYSSINIKFQGNFIPTNKDFCSIQYGISSFSGSFNKIIQNAEFDDSAFISYGLKSFYSTRGA